MHEMPSQPILEERLSLTDREQSLEMLFVSASNLALCDKDLPNDLSEEENSKIVAEFIRAAEDRFTLEKASLARGEWKAEESFPQLNFREYATGDSFAIILHRKYREMLELFRINLRQPYLAALGLSGNPSQEDIDDAAAKLVVSILIEKDSDEDSKNSRIKSIEASQAALHFSQKESVLDK